MTAPDAAGVLGVALTLLAYGGVQLDRLDPRGMRAGLLNLSGSLLILFSLAYHFNLSAALMEGAWALFALYGLTRTAMRRHRGGRA